MLILAPLGLEDGLDGVLGRREDVAVGVCHLETALVESPVRQDPSAEEELLLGYHPADVGVAVADAVKPLVEGLVVMTVLLVPNVDAELVISTEPLLYVHFSSPVTSYSTELPLHPVRVFYALCHKNEFYIGVYIQLMISPCSECIFIIILRSLIIKRWCVKRFQPDFEQNLNICNHNEYTVRLYIQ